MRAAAKKRNPAALPVLFVIGTVFAAAGYVAWHVLRAWDAADRARGTDRRPEDWRA